MGEGGFQVGEAVFVFVFVFVFQVEEADRRCQGRSVFQPNRLKVSKKGPQMGNASERKETRKQGIKKDQTSALVKEKVLIS